MRLDDALATATDASSVFQSDERRRAELRADILAASVRKGRFVRASGSVGRELIDPGAFSAYPTVLRRTAALLAGLLPVGVDRLAGRLGAGALLATALSLHTGLPAAVLGVSRRTPLPCLAGEIHPGERVVLAEAVTHSGSAAVRGIEWIKALGADPLLTLTVVDRGGRAVETMAEAGSALRALFTIDDTDDTTPDHRTSPTEEP
jgi:orotate phosphoribosyltransferase